MAPHYTLVVVGSGYGGAVIAARVAKAWAGTDRTICLLERGRELRPGEYPDTLAGAVQEIQVDLPGGHRRSPSALFDFRVNPDMTAVVGCGLGGTSLINAGVVLDPHLYPTPEESVFKRPGWPDEIRKDIAKGISRGWVAEAWKVLSPAEYGGSRPDGTKHPDWEKLGKLRSLERVAARVSLAPVAVNFPGNDATRPSCTGCGDCVSGCNYGAKNTLLTNYLPMAAQHGVSMFTETRVRRVERFGESWLVHFELLGADRERFGASEAFVAADKVVLAGGTLGSTEILLRSREAGLCLSDRLGQQFSGNGDVLSLAYDTNERVNGVGFGSWLPGERPAPGPCISGMIRVSLGDGPSALVQEGVIPGALAPLLRAGLPAAALFRGRSEGGHPFSLGARVETLLLRGASTSHIFLAMFADPETGRLELQDDRVRIVWPGAGKHAHYRELEDWLRCAAESQRGTFVPSPFGSVTVHPLGGCVMADGAEQGVVNDRGQVFAGVAGGAVHPGLFVCDGAIIPIPLGINPLLTIASLAERTATYVK